MVLFRLSTPAREKSKISSQKSLCAFDRSQIAGAFMVGRSSRLRGFCCLEGLLHDRQHGRRRDRADLQRGRRRRLAAGLCGGRDLGARGGEGRLHEGRHRRWRRAKGRSRWSGRTSSHADYWSRRRGEWRARAERAECARVRLSRSARFCPKIGCQNKRSTCSREQLSWAVLPS